MNSEARRFKKKSRSNHIHTWLDRNCIEIVMKLVEMGLVKVVYTLNAKEYLTPEHLRLEIQDEVCGAQSDNQLCDRSSPSSVSL
jgi:E3 UFM1-protein ligase 1